MNSGLIILLGLIGAVFLLGGVAVSFYRRAKQAQVKGKNAAEILETLQEELEKETEK